MNKNKILVIDDEDIVRTSCRRVLAPEGFDVDTSTNGVDGMKLIREKPYDLVLTDLKMPDMDGIEVLREIQRQQHKVKVIVITGYSTVETAVKAIKLGAFNYIEKPFTPDSLLRAVKEALAE